MPELYLGTKVEGADADVAQLEAFFKGTTPLSFPELMTLWNKMTKVTLVKITTSSTPVTTMNEEILYETPTPT